METKRTATRIAAEITCWRKVQGEDALDNLRGEFYRGGNLDVYFLAERTRFADPAWRPTVYGESFARSGRIDRVGILVEREGVPTTDLDDYRRLIEGTAWESARVQQLVDQATY